jgi:FlhB-like protein
MTDEKPKPGRKAVALRYDVQESNAPRVVAKGNRLLAERIIEIARENDIPIHEDPDLVAVLSKLDVEREIPEALYRAVAEVLAYVYRLNQTFRREE